MASRKVAVVGAGCSGLAAIKCCKDEDLVPVCFERTDDVGGLWRYTDEVYEGQACVMRSTVINTSKEITAFSDFLVPDDFPNYMHNKYLYKYFKMYAEHFDLLKHIRYNTEVLSIKQADDFIKTGQWVVKSKDRSGKELEEIYDGVLVCTGHHANKNMPKFEGQEDFQGKVIHSHDYRKPEGLENKNVIVMGVGNSGVDVAVELAPLCDQVYLSTRRGAWVLNRVWDDGIPLDMRQSRLQQFVLGLVPHNVSDYLMEKKLQKRFRHEDYGMKPNHRISAQHPTVNDYLPNRIISGDIIVKPDIRRLTKNDVEFNDGSIAENVDVVIAATGYIFGFPFIDKSVIDVKENKIELYKYCFPPDLEHPTLAVIGCYQPLGSIMPIAELQCRLATRLIKGLAKLPSRDEMWADIRQKAEAISSRYVKSSRHTIQVDWLPFMDELAELIGCKPNLFQLLLRDPALALRCIFGPVTPLQYRLEGPGTWPGARKAIFTIWDRCLPINKRGRLTVKDSTTNYWSYVVLGLFLLIVYRILFG